MVHRMSPPSVRQGLGLSLTIGSFTITFAIMKITIVYDLGFDKQPSPTTRKDMYTKDSEPTRYVTPSLCHRCHLQDKIM
jgi:hypothetical protein